MSYQFSIVILYVSFAEQRNPWGANTFAALFEKNRPPSSRSGNGREEGTTAFKNLTVLLQRSVFSKAGPWFWYLFVLQPD